MPLAAMLHVLAHRLNTTTATHRLIPWAAEHRLVMQRAERAWHNPDIRATAIAHMTFLLGKSPRAAEVEPIAQRYVYETFKDGALRWRPWLVDHRHVSDVEILRQASKGGCGVIVSFLHHGQFYGSVPSLKRLGIQRMLIPADPLHFAERRDSFHRQGIATMERAGGAVYFNAIGSYPRIAAALREGATVMLSLDVPGSTPATVLGRRVLVSGGLTRLAMETGALVVPIFAQREGSGLQSLAVGDPLEPASYSSHSDLLDALIRRHEPALLAWPEALQLPMQRWLPADGVGQAGAPTSR